MSLVCLGMEPVPALVQKRGWTPICLHCQLLHRQDDHLQPCRAPHLHPLGEQGQTVVHGVVNVHFQVYQGWRSGGAGNKPDIWFLEP